MFIFSHFFSPPHSYERMFWSSKQHATTEQNTETFGEIGSQPISNLQRETLSVSADLFSSYVPAMVQAMVDALKAPLFLEPDVNREKQVWFIVFQEFIQPIL
ncbi:MAG: insulinase family protein [archaeon]|nr:insulinase family protein [archaeon]